MDLRLIKTIAERKHITIRELSERVGVSENHIHRLVRDNKTKAMTLERLAQVLGEPVENFFDESVRKPATDSHTAIANGNGSSAEANDYRGAVINAAEQEIENLKEQIRLLTDNNKLQKALIAEKERTIALLLRAQQPNPAPNQPSPESPTPTKKDTKMIQ